MNNFSFDQKNWLGFRIQMLRHQYYKLLGLTRDQVIALNKN